ncbi:DUF3592 domain-containing protein [Kitasatospora sp. NPDC101183]|uniref:DUF3592 domain-containing protein n=1 Tax=Kitasatospora sp. NPDC101183 TaxID=3364100 RepID=UPI003805472E
MTTPTVAPPSGPRSVELARDFVTGGVVGLSLTGFAVGCELGRAPLIVGSLALAAGYALVFLLAGAPQRAREAAQVPCTALALIEGREADKSEDTDVPVRFDLTVAPDGESAFRVRVTQGIHVSELPDYRLGRVVVVEYPPDRPWRVRIVKRPTPAWEERAASAAIDSLPGPAAAGAREEGCARGFLVLLGLLLGAGAVLFLLRADLFDDTGEAQTQTPTVSSTTVTRGYDTVSFGPGRSMLDRGALRSAVESTTPPQGGRRALTLVVEERLMTVAFAPDGVDTPGFDPRELPFDRVPALVEEARSTPGVGAPRTWRVIVERLSGSVTIRVAVTGADGSAVLEADGQGAVLRRNPAR